MGWSTARPWRCPGGTYDRQGSPPGGNGGPLYDARPTVPCQSCKGSHLRWEIPLPPLWGNSLRLEPVERCYYPGQQVVPERKWEGLVPEVIAAVVRLPDDLMRESVPTKVVVVHPELE